MNREVDVAEFAAKVSPRAMLLGDQCRPPDILLSDGVQRFPRDWLVGAGIEVKETAQRRVREIDCTTIMFDSPNSNVQISAVGAPAHPGRTPPAVPGRGTGSKPLTGTRCALRRPKFALRRPHVGEMKPIAGRVAGGIMAPRRRRQGQAALGRLTRPGGRRQLCPEGASSGLGAGLQSEGVPQPLLRSMGLLPRRGRPVRWSLGHRARTREGGPAFGARRRQRT